MTIDSQPNKKQVLAGRILSGLVLVPMVLSALMKASRSPAMAAGFAHLGVPLTMLPTLIVLETIAIVLYVIPATSVVGAIVLTGYMGGAICTHLRVGENVVIQTLIPILAWLALYLREPRLRVLLPLRP